MMEGLHKTKDCGKENHKCKISNNHSKFTTSFSRSLMALHLLTKYLYMEPFFFCWIMLEKSFDLNTELI